MLKYTLSKPVEDCNTLFLERDGFELSCPYHIDYDEKNKPSNVNCGDWCPLFDLQDLKDKRILYLLCGSGNAAYTIEAE